MDVNMTGEVKFELQVPEKLWETFTWYIQKTAHYIGHKHANHCYNQMIVTAIQDYLEAEVSSGVPEARYALTEELKLMLE